MSRLGNELVRAPAIPSNEIERTPSNAPTSVTLATVCGFPKELPPSVDVAIRKTACFWWESSQTAYTLPVLSVRIEQPWRPACCGLSKAELRVVGRDQVSPPSVEWLTAICSGPVSCWLLNS